VLQLLHLAASASSGETVKTKQISESQKTPCGATCRRTGTGDIARGLCTLSCSKRSLAWRMNLMRAGHSKAIGRQSLIALDHCGLSPSPGTPASRPWTASCFRFDLGYLVSTAPAAIGTEVAHLHIVSFPFPSSFLPSFLLFFFLSFLPSFFFLSFFFVIVFIRWCLMATRSGWAR
jgi:hypothetical protein